MVRQSLSQDNDNNNQPVGRPPRGLPPTVPSKFNLYNLIIETRHLFSQFMQLRDNMPRGQKDSSGVCACMTKHADHALYLANLIADYSSRHTREQHLRDLNITLNHLKELTITSFERGYISKRNTLDHLSTKIIKLSDTVVSYAQGLEKRTQERRTKRQDPKPGEGCS